MPITSRLCCLAFLVPLATACAAGAGGGRVQLEHYEALVTTHFGGIPAGSLVCARLHNPRAVPVDWVRLRLRSESGLGTRPARWTSQWLYDGRIEPGETVAVELPDAPPAERVELTLRGSGRGSPRGRGARNAERTDACSELWLLGRLAAESEARPDAEVDSIAVHTPPGSEILVAEEP